SSPASPQLGQVGSTRVESPASGGGSAYQMWPRGQAKRRDMGYPVTARRWVHDGSAIPGRVIEPRGIVNNKIRGGTAPGRRAAAICERATVGQFNSSSAARSTRTSTPSLAQNQSRPSPPLSVSTAPSSNTVPLVSSAASFSPPP